MTTSANEEQKLRKSLAGSNTTITYHSRAAAELQLEQGQSGRFVDKASVVGAEASVRYPRLPPDNPFSSDISGLEPSLGYEINSQEPTGNYHEIEESLAAQPTDSLTSGGAAAPDCATPLGSQSGVPFLRGRRL
jgi:hypothetical protein